MADDQDRADLFGGTVGKVNRENNPYADEGPTKPEDLEKDSLLQGADPEKRHSTARSGGQGLNTLPIEDDGEVQLDFDDLNFSAEDIDFATIDADLEQFRRDPIVEDALKQGVDLRQYARQIDKELREVELRSIKDYVDNCEGVSQLFGEIGTCETVLLKMQSMLQGFQQSLGGISDEIRHLQEESLSMNTKLRNRRSVATQLQSFLDHVAVTPELIHTICDGVINQEFCDALDELSHKIVYNTQGASTRERTATEPTPAAGALPALEVEQLDIPAAGTMAGRDALPQLSRLSVKATDRCREFLLLKLAELRKPKTNVKVLQEHVLLRHAALMRFLVRHAPEASAEVKASYSETMERLLQGLFKTYHSSLAKLTIPGPASHDTIVPGTPASSIFKRAAAAGKQAAGRGGTGATELFKVGIRDSILQEVDSPAIIVHVAQAAKKRFHYEAVFRSLQRHLMDAVGVEYTFDVRFFGSQDVGQAVFESVASKTLEQSLTQLGSYLETCFDPVALLLMIGVTTQHRQLMKRRQLTCMEAYFDRVMMVLWPRFKTVLDHNIASVRHADVAKHVASSLEPHPIAIRFGEFVSTVLYLHGVLRAQDVADEMTVPTIIMFRQLQERLWVQMAGQLERRNPLLGKAFVLNQLDVCVAMLHDRGVTTDGRADFDDVLQQRLQALVDDIINSTFKSLVAFVRSAENDQRDTAATSSEPPIAELDKMRAIIHDFAATWRPGLEQINKSVTQLCNRRDLVMEMLKQSFTRLLLFYQRFEQTVKDRCPRQGFVRDLVPVSAILEEAKRFSRG